MPDPIDLTTATVLVTGGSGFIGRSVVGALRTAGAAVRVADLNPFPDPDVPAVVGDLRDPAKLDRATDGVDAIVHLAALTRVLQSIEMPGEVFSTNVAVTQELLERARTGGARAFVLASTNAVVGDVGSTPITTDLAVRPLTPYGATKAAGEMLVSAYAACYGIAGSALRFTNVYGPGMLAKDSMVPRLMRAALSGDTVSIFGDGTQVRDFVHVDDVVASIMLALTTGMTGTMIVGSGHSPSVNELVAAVRRATGVDVATDHVPAKPGEMPAVIVDLAGSRSRGYQPTIDLDQGLVGVWEEFQAAD